MCQVLVTIAGLAHVPCLHTCCHQPPLAEAWTAPQFTTTFSTACICAQRLTETWRMCTGHTSSSTWHVCSTAVAVHNSASYPVAWLQQRTKQACRFSRVGPVAVSVPLLLAAVRSISCLLSRRRPDPNPPSPARGGAPSELSNVSCRV